MSTTKDQAISALAGIVQTGDKAGIVDAVPGATLAKQIVDPILAAIGGATGVKTPTLTQLAAFVVPVQAGWPLIAGAVAYDWWRDDGFAGGKSLEVLGPLTEVAGWPPSFQVAFCAAWFTAIEALPGKGGWKGKKLWKDRLSAYQKGASVTYTVPGTQITRTIQKATMPTYADPIAQGLVSGSAAVWQSYTDSQGLAKDVPNLPPMTDSQLDQIAKTLIFGDKLGTLAGAVLIQNGQTYALAGLIQSQAQRIASDDSIVAGGGAKQEAQLVRITETKSNNGGVIALLAIAAALAVANG